MEKPLKKKKKVAKTKEVEKAPPAKLPERKKAMKKKTANGAEDNVEELQAEAAEASKPVAVKKKKRKLDDGAISAEAVVPEKKAKGAKKKTPVVEAPEALSEEAPPKPGAGNVASTVFVDGVPYDWSLDQLKEFFVQKCGDVSDVRAPTWQDSGRLRGFCHVSFATSKAKDKALALDGTKVGKKGRYLKIEAAKDPSQGNTVKAEDIEGKRRLFVKNLPYDATEQDISALFKQCGKVIDIRIPHHAGRSKGFAYVEFAKSQGLRAAMEMTPAPSLNGRTLKLDADAGSGPKAGFHHRPEAFKSGVVAAGKEQKKAGKGKGKGRGKGKPEKLSLF
eukprot:TRINITY_DN54139_c0_g1_i1.p1 TRINITY_DN54139_c0_g1~~TRINITY_DN54139_c0_g1_i1.p1  ORF type:complete len:334 (-),score=105.23 TRINITY_DN54139_c0_g1_i1:43-1044(-)